MFVPKVQGAASSAAIQATADPTPPTAMPVDPLVIVLAAPIKSHKGEIRELRMRKPVAADFIEIGRMPFDVRGEGEDKRAIVDFKLAATWLARLTDHDEIVIGQLSQLDFMLAVARINVLLTGAGKVGN